MTKEYVHMLQNAGVPNSNSLWHVS